MGARPSSSIATLVLALVVLGLGVGAGVVWLGGVDLSPWLSTELASTELQVIQIDGQVTIADTGGEERPLDPGERVLRHDRVTTHPDGAAILRSGEDLELRLDGATTIQVREVRQDSIEVELADGQVRAEVRTGGRALRVSGEGKAVVTRDGAVRIAVREGLFAAQVERGSAQIEGEGSNQMLRAGERAVGLADGSTSIGAIPDEVVLDVAWPDGGRTRQQEFALHGRTDPGTVVELRVGEAHLRAQADREGRFRLDLSLQEGVQVVVLQATDPFGQQVEATVELERDTTPPRFKGGVEAP